MAMTPQVPREARAADERRSRGADVVDTRPEAAALVRTLRSAAGFRVDGPDGRIGVLRGVTPREPSAPPEQLLVSMGLFIVTTVSIEVAEVRSVDAARRRIVVAVTPQPERRRPAELARRIRRFVRVAARRAARDKTTGTSGRQR